MDEADTHDRSRRAAPKRGSDRVFGLVFAALFAWMGTLPWMRGGALRVWALPVAAAFFLVAIVRPRLLSWLNELWFRLGMQIQRVTSAILLAVVSFGVLTPIALVRRALGADPLRLKRRPRDTSYWAERDGGVATAASLRRQF